MTETDLIERIEHMAGELGRGLEPGAFDRAGAEALHAKLVRARRLLQASEARLAARVAETGSWKDAGERSAAHHLARCSGTSIRRAEATLDTQRRMAKLPETRAAFESGAISAEQAEVVAEAAAVDPSAERSLLATALGTTMHGLRREAERVKAAAIDDEERDRRHHRRRGLSYGTGLDGGFRMAANGRVLDGAIVAAGLEAMRARVWARARAEGRTESYEALLFDQLVEMARVVTSPQASAEPDVDAQPTVESDSNSAVGERGDEAADASGDAAGVTNRAGDASCDGRDDAAGVSGGTSGGSRCCDASAEARDVSGHAADVANVAGGTGHCDCDARDEAIAGSGDGVDACEASDEAAEGSTEADHGGGTRDGARGGELVLMPAAPDAPAAAPAPAPAKPKKKQVREPRVGPRNVVRVVVDWSALRRGETWPGECCEIPGLGPVPVSVARDLLGDALLEVVLRWGTDVRTIATAGRHVARKLAIGLEVRDTTCIGLGCSSDGYYEGDHDLPFAQGGPTSFDNLNRLCGHHHWLKTYAGWCVREIDGHRVLVPPDLAGPDPP